MVGRYAVLPGKRELTGIDPAMTRRITRQLKVLCVQYPRVAKRMVGINSKNGTGCMNMRTGLPGNPDVWDDSMATCVTTVEQNNKTGKSKLHSFAIGFNPLYFASEKQATEIYRGQVGNPVGANCPEGTVTHEFGHALHLHLREMIKDFDEKLTKVSLYEDSKSNPLCVHVSTEEMRMDAVSPDDRCREYYAREVFAHAFSAMYLGTPKAQQHPVTEFVRKSIESHKGKL